MSINQETDKLPYETPPAVIDPDLAQDALQEVKMMRRYAVLSSVAYNLYNTAYKTANKNMRDFLPKHTLVPELSDDHSAVITKHHRDNSTDVIISYRGTQNLTDLAVDAVQIATGSPLEKLAGMNTGYFRVAQDKFDAVKDMYPDANITTTGHSLGGSLGYYIGKRNNVKSYVFNAGSSPLDLITEKGLTDTVDNISTHYHVAGDFVGGSKAVFGSSKDRLVTVEPTQWMKDLVGTLGGIGTGFVLGGVPGAIVGGAVGTSYALFNDLHGLHNFLPPETFKKNLEPEDLLYQWVKPLSDVMEANALSTRRPIVRNFGEPQSINRSKFMQRCFNPYDKRCRMSKQ